jgi:hypothetical protein
MNFLVALDATLILEFRQFYIFLRNFSTKVYTRRKNEVEKPLVLLVHVRRATQIVPKIISTNNNMNNHQFIL